MQHFFLLVWVLLGDRKKSVLGSFDYFLWVSKQQTQQTLMDARAAEGVAV